LSTVIEFGIDLGTTNSCIARWESGSVRVFQNNDQMNVTPSAIHILKSGRTIIGRRAHAALLTDSDNVAIEFKRWLGQKDRKLFPSIGKEFSSEELSAEILKALKEDVKRATGDEVTSAVITVPAAFGALQCEATARAAELAGLIEAPLLQEPVAAAIGYGIKPGSENQKWLVFDLGGGTLDIAVVSTKDGRLNVLEHRGNNLLGGKDVDRLILEEVVIPALKTQFDVRSLDTGARSRLRSRLLAKAEEAKIDLSREEEVVISLFDLGDDDAGTPIEQEIAVTRTRLAEVMEHLLAQCCALVGEAIEGARIHTKDLDRILLVGGPTQSPLVRARLQSEFGIPVDFSVDPMTVVGRGAAIYAATLEKTNQAPILNSPETVVLKLAFEPVSADLQPAVAGMVTSPDKAVQIKVDAEGGGWTSGWLSTSGGFFETAVQLSPADITTFWTYSRDSKGRLLDTQPSEFRIRHGLVPTAPPLPHTLSFELLGSDGKPQLDPVFPKGSPLPVEKTIRYRAAHSVSPDRPDSSLAIKLWEGEFLSDPDTNEWVCNLVLAHDGVKRAIPQGSEIEVDIKISASRLINVSAFVPILNQHFTNNVYLAQREEQDYSLLSKDARKEMASFDNRLADLSVAASNDAQAQAEIEVLRKELEQLRSRAPESSDVQAAARPVDPDDARRLVENSKGLRGKIGRLERKTTATDSLQSLKFTEELELAEGLVNDFGTSMDKTQLEAYKRELERVGVRGDDKALSRLTGDIEQLRWRVLFRQDWYWADRLDRLAEPGTAFTDQSVADELIVKAKLAAQNGDGQALREAVRGLWKLQPKSAQEQVGERAMESGLRRY
jgi:molecular chaperone DnaK